MALPLLRYRPNPSERTLRQVPQPLLTTWDADWAGYMGGSLRDMLMDLRIPPLATDAELKQLTMPLLVLRAENDISFPGKAVVERIRACVPHASGDVIANCKHCPPTTDAFRNWLGARLTSFFAPQAYTSAGMDHIARP